MNTRFFLLTSALLASAPLAFAQPKPAPPQPVGLLEQQPKQPKDSPDDVIFDLDFPGGTPIELVKAMEKAIGKPLNVIVSAENKDHWLPGLKLYRVSARQVFMAMELASARIVNRAPVPDSQGRLQYQREQESYGFRPVISSDRTVWVFFHIKVAPLPPQPVACRFYPLGPYLQDLNLKVEDITTAVQTGWSMMKVDPLPVMNFHKETQLLIVVGEKERLSVIDDVLKELSAGSRGRRTGSIVPPAPGIPAVAPVRAPPSKK